MSDRPDLITPVSPRTNMLFGSSRRAEEIPPVRTAAAELRKSLLSFRLIRKSGVGNLDKATDELDDAIVSMLDSLWNQSLFSERVRRQ